ncbi:MAG: TolC family protein [Elusimicrobiales bacterium]|nr:TolC family protein [Elusimicrobiales bacterium]
MLFARLAAALLLALPAAAAAQGAEPLSIDDAVSLAVKNSPAALAAEQDIIIARQRVREARFMALPQFTLSGIASRASLEYPAVLGAELGESYLSPVIDNSFYTLRAQALQPLYTGGKNTNTLKLAKTAHNQAKMNYETAKADASLAAKKAFYTLLYQRRLSEAAREWLRRARALEAALRKDPFEELEASMLLAGLEDKARQAGGEQEAAEADFLRALNLEPGALPRLEGAFEPLPVEADPTRSLVTAMELRPELKSEIYKAQMDDIAVNMAMVRRYPTIYLGASYDANAYRLQDLGDAARRSNNWLASLAIRFPLSYDVWTQVQQRRAQQRQGELKRAELQDKVRFEIMSAHKEASSWQAEALKLAGETARMKAGYEAALRTARPSMAALRALCALCELDRKALDAVYRQLLARIRLEWARGRDLPR